MRGFPCRLLSSLLLSACLLFAVPQVFACQTHGYATADAIHLHGQALMIVTHATSTHDARFASKRGTDEAIRFAREHGIPRVYLGDDTPERYYYMDDCDPDYWFRSQGGELDFEIRPAQVYLIGGHLELCLNTTMNAVLYSWSRQRPRDLTLTIFMDAVYSNGRSITPEMPYYPAMQKAMSVIMHGRPMGEHWGKISLLATMGIIDREDWQIDYLKSVLPRYDTTLPDYRVELQINDDRPLQLQAGRERKAPTLRLRFVDSSLTPLLAGP